MNYEAYEPEDTEAEEEITTVCKDCGYEAHGEWFICPSCGTDLSDENWKPQA